MNFASTDQILVNPKMSGTAPISQSSESAESMPGAEQTRFGFIGRLMLRTQSSSFVRNAALLSIGTAAAQGFSVLAAPLLTRIYQAPAIGQLALFSSFISVASVSVSLKYELGIVSAANDSEAAQLTYASVLLSIPVSILSGVVFYLAIRFSWLGFGALPTYATLLMVATLFLIGIFTALRYWALRQGHFSQISKTTVGQHAARAFSQVGLGFVGGGSGGLMVGELIGRMMGVAQIFQAAWPKVRCLLVGISVRDLLRTLNGNRKLMVYSLPSTFIDTLVANLPIPLIVKLYGVEAGGYFALVQRVLAVPLGLIAASVADTFHSGLARCARDNPNHMLTLFKRTSIWLFGIGLLPALIIALCGRPLFRVVFGSQWAIAGTLAALSTPWFITQFIVSPLSRLVFVLRGQEVKLIYDVVILASMFAVGSIAFQSNWSLFETVWAFSLVNTFAYVVYYLVLMWIISKSTQRLEREVPR
jgi:lipopolysaccharide exporter